MQAQLGSIGSSGDVAPQGRKLRLLGLHGFRSIAGWMSFFWLLQRTGQPRAGIYICLAKTLIDGSCVHRTSGTILAKQMEYARLKRRLDDLVDIVSPGSTLTSCLVPQS